MAINVLANNSMLAVLKVSQWTARKLDKGATARVLSDAKASNQAGSFHKQLVSKEALGEIASLVGEARTYHYSATLAWLDDGPRILPVARYEDYVSRMDEFEGKFRRMVASFVNGYDDYVQKARSMLGDLFREADYPSAHRIADHFGWECTMLPMPDKADFRATLSDAALAKIQDDMEKRVQSAMGLAVRDVFERVHDRVAAMVEKLTAYKPASGEHKAQGVFRDSLVENVRALVDVLPDLNVTNDPRINTLAATMRTLCAHNADALRDDDKARAAVAAKAADILQQVSDMMA